MSLDGTYICTSAGPKNNNLLEECNFTFIFEDGFTYNCPQCSSPLRRVTQGRSVSEILRSGQQAVNTQLK